MASTIEERTAKSITLGSFFLRTTLQHKNQVFNNSHLALVAAYIQKGHIPVVISQDVEKALGGMATYVSEDLNSIDGLKIPGNTLYLSDVPEKLGQVLIHEAVHIFADIHGKNEFIWDHEELAVFVEAFVTSQVMPVQMKKKLNINVEYALGFFASEFYNANPSTGAILSKAFDKDISYDFESEGGVKGKLNPYQTLARYIKKEYPFGKIRGKKTEYIFRGVF